MYLLLLTAFSIKHKKYCSVKNKYFLNLCLFSVFSSAVSAHSNDDDGD